MPGCNQADETQLIGTARRLLSTYEDMAELIRLGAYRAGSDPAVDEAIKYRPAIEAFLTQGKDEKADLDAGFDRLASILDGAVA
jgi:flagellum-specific ATP synthase